GDLQGPTIAGNVCGHKQPGGKGDLGGALEVVALTQEGGEADNRASAGKVEIADPRRGVGGELVGPSVRTGAAGPSIAVNVVCHTWQEWGFVDRVGRGGEQMKVGICRVDEHRLGCIAQIRAE